LVSRSKPKPLDVDAALARYVKTSRAELFDPWRRMMAASDDLSRDTAQIVELLQVFFNKWVVELLVVLGQGETRRFNELKKMLPGISGRTLAARLRDLESQGFVKRALFDEMPVRVEYSLTKRGMEVATLALPLVLYLMASRD